MDTAELVRAGAGEGRSIEGSTKASGSSNVASVMSQTPFCLMSEGAIGGA